MGPGVHQDSTFVSLLSTRYPELNILNGGVIGYFTSDYLAVTNYLIDKIDIQKLTICYCLNDTYNNFTEIIDNMPGGTLRKYFDPILTWLRSHSKLYLFAKNLISDRSKKYFEYDLQPYMEEENVYHSAVDDLIVLANKAKKRNIQFEIVLLPYEYQLRKKESQMLLPQTLLSKDLTLSGVTCYDLYPYLSEQTDIDYKSIYLFADGIHFSNKGHRMISNFFSDYVINDE